MSRRRAGPGQGNGLIEALTSRETPKVPSLQRLPGLDESFDPVDEVDVDAAEVDDRHEWIPEALNDSRPAQKRGLEAEMDWLPIPLRDGFDSVGFPAFRSAR